MKLSSRWMVFAVLIVSIGSMHEAAGSQSRFAEFELESYLRVSASSGGEQVDVINLSQLGITAFSLELRTEFGDGTSSISRLTEDFAVTGWYEQSPSLPHKAGVLHPGQFKRLTVGLPARPGSMPTSSTIQVVAVVFADRSAVGDEEVLTKIFRGREAEQLVRHHWIQRLDEVLSVPMAEAQLRMQLQGFQAVLQEKAEVYGNDRVSSSSLSASTQEKTILHDLESALRPKSSGEVLKRLEILRSILGQEFDLMKKHVTHDVKSLPTQSR